MHSKDEFLCIIHDKMDHAKIALPRLQITNKMICGFVQLPIMLTGMIVHGHGDERYA
jgi:ABC-type iron transport system FetAB permease component